MPGVGKTALVTQLAQQIQDEFDYVFWRSAPTVLSFDSMITDLLSFVSNHKESKPEINRVIHYLRTRRCLIILDHLDMVGDVDHLKYIQLIKIIAETHHQSCLIFTIREQPQEVAFLEKWLLSVRSLKLLGSSEIAFSLIQSKQLLGSDQQKYELCNLYSNNPLKVKTVVSTIIDLYDSNISKFPEQNT
jgi:NB-ARC domain